MFLVVLCTVRVPDTFTLGAAFCSCIVLWKKDVLATQMLKVPVYSDIPSVFVLSAYLEAMKGKCDPFKKMKVSKIQNSLQSWAKDNNFVLDVLSAAMKARNKKVVTKTFHNAGLVVPWNKRTELGYRELIETDGECWKSDQS
jgi:hypothetical protein